MPEKTQMIAELLQGLDTIRPTVIAGDDESANFRSLLRRMVALLERLQTMPHVHPSVHQKVVDLLITLLDAEHGTLLKRIHDNDIHDSVWLGLEQHVKARKALIDASLQDLPYALRVVRKSFDLLGKTHPETDDLSENFKQFERKLRLYLRANHQVRAEFNLLISALNNSVKAMDDVLDQVGEKSPELKHVQRVLEHDLPQDSEQAQKLLRKAREYILQAGDKLNQASHQVRKNMSEQVKQMKILSKRLEHAEEQAKNDPLTGLGNRRKLEEFFADLPADVRSTFLMIDIDHFKHINDQYGHDAGDVVLEKLGELLKVAIRNTDMVARLGGEEFCVVLPQTTAAQGHIVAENIRKTVETESFSAQNNNIDVKVSIGVAERAPHEKITSWLKRADEALYHAKQHGRNQVHLAI